MGIIMWQLKQHCAARNGRKTQQSYDWSLHLEVRCQPRSSHSCYKLHSTKGYVEENSFELIKAERLDDQRTKGRDAATWDAIFL